jgi:hypothetical protein
MDLCIAYSYCKFGGAQMPRFITIIPLNASFRDIGHRFWLSLTPFLTSVAPGPSGERRVARSGGAKPETATHRHRICMILPIHDATSCITTCTLELCSPRAAWKGPEFVLYRRHSFVVLSWLSLTPQILHMVILPVQQTFLCHHALLNPLRRLWQRPRQSLPYESSISTKMSPQIPPAPNPTTSL